MRGPRRPRRGGNFIPARSIARAPGGRGLRGGHTPRGTPGTGKPASVIGMGGLQGSEGRMRIRHREPAAPRRTGSPRSKLLISLPFIHLPAPLNEVVILRPEGPKSQGVQGGNVTGATWRSWGKLRIADCGLRIVPSAECEMRIGNRILLRVLCAFAV